MQNKEALIELLTTKINNNTDITQKLKKTFKLHKITTIFNIGLFAGVFCIFKILKNYFLHSNLYILSLLKDQISIAAIGAFITYLSFSLAYLKCSLIKLDFSHDDFNQISQILNKDEMENFILQTEKNTIQDWILYIEKIEQQIEEGKRITKGVTNKKELLKLKKDTNRKTYIESLYKETTK